MGVHPCTCMSGAQSINLAPSIREVRDVSLAVLSALQVIRARFCDAIVRSCAWKRVEEA